MSRNMRDLDGRDVSTDACLLPAFCIFSSLSLPAMGDVDA